MSTNRVLEVLGHLEKLADFNSCLPVLQGANLDDEQLRAVVDAKFSGDRVQMGEAYRRYGQKLVSPGLRAAVDLILSSRSPAALNSYAHVI